MKDLIIVGAGGTGRQRLDAIKKINTIEKKWNIKGFLSDDLDALKGIRCDYSIIDTIIDYTPKENDVFVCGIAMPHIKERVVNIMKAKGAVFQTIIHPRSCVGDFVEIGEGCYIEGSIQPNARLGNFVSIMSSLIGVSSIIGEYSTTTGYSNIAGAKLGKRVFVGSHAVLLGNVKVGDDSVIGAGSIVFTNVAPNVTVMGNPATILMRHKDH